MRWQMGGRPRRHGLIRRALLALGVAVFGLLLVLGVEIWLAVRRDYLPTDQPLELDGTFGMKRAGVSATRLVVLGDSTSVGVGVDDAADAYPTRLAQRLAEETGRLVELSVLGVSGARVDDLLREQAPSAVALDPDVVFIGIGANDVTHLTSLDRIRSEMEQTLQILGQSDATIVVAGAPDMRVSVWHEPLRHLAYLRGKQVTDAIEDVARAQGVAIVELAQETGPFFAEDPEGHFSDDGFHPGALGYRRWADAIFPVLLDAVMRSWT